MIPMFQSTPSYGIGGALQKPPFPFLPPMFLYLPPVSILYSSSLKFLMSTQFPSPTSSSTCTCLSGPLALGTPYGSACCKIAIMDSCPATLLFIFSITKFILLNECYIAYNMYGVPSLLFGWGDLFMLNI